MDKQQLIRDLKQTTKASFITKKELASYMGMKNQRYVDQYLHGLERVSGKYYFIPDVAEALKARCTL